MANPIRNFRFKFKLSVPDLGEEQFTDVAGFNATTDVIEYRTGDQKEIQKFPGITKFGNITLKRAAQTEGSSFWKLLVKYVDSDGIDPNNIEKFSGTLSAIDYTTGDALAEWQFFKAFPIKYTAPDFTAKGNDVAIESLEMVVERISRTK